jgi:hypothetical protein
MESFVRGLRTLINVATMTNVMQVNPSEFYIKFVKDTVVSDAKLAFQATLQPLVWKCVEPVSHFINLSTHSPADTGRQIVKCF